MRRVSGQKQIIGRSLLALSSVSTPSRHFIDPHDVFWQAFLCTLSVWWGGITARNFVYLRSHGLFRQRYEIDKTPPKDYPLARWIGGFLGFLLYVFYLAPVTSWGVTMPNSIRVWSLFMHKYGQTEYLGPGPSNIFRRRELREE